MKLTLTLDYDLGEGFLGPHRDGLRRGEVVAGHCTACGRVALPPEQTCTCGARAPVPLLLDGAATVLWRTTGTDGDVALVRFDGSDTLSLARLQGFDRQTRGKVSANAEAGLVLDPEDTP